MKLIDKLNRRYIGYSFLSLVVVGILIYCSISYVVSKQIDEQLADISHRIENKLEMGGHIEYLSPFVEIRQESEQLPANFTKDTTIFNKNEKEPEVFRQLTRITTINNQTYKIIVRESKIESEDLITTLVLIIILAILLMTLTLVLVNRKVAKAVWSPFYKNLQIIKQFSMHDHSTIKLIETGILEFDELNNCTHAAYQKNCNRFFGSKTVFRRCFA